MAPTETIPVFLITGFLGSGKSVLLNALLQRPSLADSAVIVNEFGEVGLDHLLVSSARENIVLLDAGCLCCTVQGSLKETLIDLHQRRAGGELPAFRRVIIETTGLADPGPIVQSIMRHGVVSHLYRLAGLICVVDALHAEAQLNEYVEAQAQIACADRIVITKTDLLDGICPDALLNRVRALNPGADLLVASFGQVSPDALLRPGSGEEGLPWLGRLQPADPQHGHELVAASHGPGHAAAHDPAIRSESFLTGATVTWSGLAVWTDVMRRRYGRNLLRCKGIVNVRGAPVLVHGVQSLFETRRLPAWPDAERRSRLVVIGKGLRRAELEVSLGWLAQPDGTQAPPDPCMPPPSEERHSLFIANAGAQNAF